MLKFEGLVFLKNSIVLFYKRWSWAYFQFKDDIERSSSDF